MMERICLRTIVIPIVFAFALLPRNFYYLVRGNTAGTICFVCFAIVIAAYLAYRASILKKQGSGRRICLHVLIDTGLFVGGCVIASILQRNGEHSWIMALLPALLCTPFFVLNRIAANKAK